MKILESREIAVNFLKGKAGNKLNWVFDAGLISLRQVIGNKPSNEIRNQFRLDIGSFLNWHAVDPCKDEWQNLSLTRKQEEDKEIISWKHPSGTLSEERLDGQIVKHLVSTADELNIYLKMCEDLVVKVNDEPDHDACKLEEQMPIVFCSNTSPVQEALQRITGVQNFYYLMIDAPKQLNALLDIMMEHQRKRYKIMSGSKADFWYQGENTSTTMISPDLYRQYSLPQIKEFADAAHSAGCKCMVHMCGLLDGLLEHIKETGIDGIESLTSPPVGDVDYENFYTIFPADTIVRARFSSIHWVNKTADKIADELEKVIKTPDIIKNHPFVMSVTSDEVPDISMENFQNLKEAFEIFNKKYFKLT